MPLTVLRYRHAVDGVGGGALREPLVRLGGVVQVRLVAVAVCPRRMERVGEGGQGVRGGWQLLHIASFRLQRPLRLLFRHQPV